MYIYISQVYIYILLESIRCFREATRSLRPPNLSSSVRVSRSSTWTRRTWKRLESPEISASRRRMWCLVKICPKKMSMIGVMIVMIGVIYLFNDLWWVNQINDYMLISLISLRDGLGRCLFFQICFLWNVVDMVPDMDGYRSTLFRIPRPRIGSMELPNTIFSGKNMRKTLFPTDYPWKQQVGQFETQVTGELIPWVLGCGTWICQVVNHLPTFRFFFIRSWQALVSFDQSFFGLFFFVWPVWRGSHALKTLQRASTEGSDCLLRKTVETYFPENLKRLTFQSRDFGSTWYGIYTYIYTYIHMYMILCMFWDIQPKNQIP